MDARTKLHAVPPPDLDPQMQYRFVANLFHGILWRGGRAGTGTSSRVQPTSFGRVSRYKHLFKRVYVCMHACMYVCICVCICEHIHAYIYIYICVCVCVCVDMSIHTHIHTYIHTYIHT